MTAQHNYEYIRRTYGVPARRNAPVKYKGRLGKVTSTYQQYIHIKFEGEKKRSPNVFHPTSDIEWLEAMPNKTTDTTGDSPVARSNQFFVQLKGYGMCDENGRTVMAIGTSTKKVIAEPDAPLSLIVSLIESMKDLMDYSSPEAAAADIKRLQNYVNNLTPT